MVAWGDYIMAIDESRIFDFWGIISNEIIGDTWLTIFIFTIFIIFITIKLKMPFELQIIFLVLILSALFSKTLLFIIWVFVVLIVGLIAYWQISKAIQS